MKLLLLIFLLPFANTPVRYRQLTWEDFRGRPNSNWAAVTHYEFEVTIVNNGETVTRQYAHALFNPSKSWARIKSERVLRHEQLHFCIAECFARQLKAGMDSDSLWNECYKVQDRYDLETNHSMDSTAQRRWEELIKL